MYGNLAESMFSSWQVEMRFVYTVVCLCALVCFAVSFKSYVHNPLLFPIQMHQISVFDMLQQLHY